MCFKVSLLPFFDDGAGQRMLGFSFQRVSSRKEFFLADAFGRNDVRHFRTAGRNRACLIQGNDLDLACVFKILARLKKDAVLGAHAVSDHDGNRCCQAQCAGAGNDEYADCVFKSSRRISTEEFPDDEYDDGNPDDGWNKDSGYFICNARNRRFRSSCIAHHVDDLGECRIFTDTRCFDADEACRIDCCGADSIACSLVDRNGFAGQGRCIDGRLAFYDFPVDRNGFARFDDEDIARLDLADTDSHDHAVPLDIRRLRRKFHKPLQSIGRTSLGERFQKLSDGNQGRNHGRRLKVKLPAVKHINRFPLHRKVRHLVEDGERPQEGNARAESDKRIHIRRSLEEGTETGREECTVHEHDNQRKNHLRDAKPDVISIQEGRNRKSQHIVSHGKVHEDGQEYEREDKSLLQLRRLPVLQRFFLGCERS